MSVLPPLDYIPKKAYVPVQLAKKELDTISNKLFDSVDSFIKNVTKLPKNCKCNDPRIQQIKQKLQDIQTQITNIQTKIQQLGNIVVQLKQIINAAAAIRQAIFYAQAFNPVTGAAFINMQLMMVQDELIVNGINSLSLLSSLPTDAINKLAGLVPMITAGIEQIGQACNGDVSRLSVSSTVTDNIIGSGNSNAITNDPFGTSANALDDKIVNQSVSKFNNLLPSEFYNEYNVSDADLIDRANVIQSVLERVENSQQQQQELLKSIQEAPSVAYRAKGAPDNALGKTGDFYVDTVSMKIYGPKPYHDSWVDNMRPT
jgi:hypothetical protein